MSSWPPCPDLASWIQSPQDAQSNNNRTAPRNSPLIVTRVPGRNDYTNFVVLKRTYGNSPTKLFPTDRSQPRMQGKLSALLPQLKRFAGVIRIRPKRRTAHPPEMGARFNGRKGQRAKKR